MFNRKTWQRRCVRFAAMSWDELRTRGGQEVAKRLDLARYFLRAGTGGEELHNLPAAGGRFVFADADLPQLVALLRQRLPSEADRITEEADRICRHRFDLLGYQNLDYGPQIDWHLDAVHGRRAPRKPWFNIRFDFAEVGDLKITWELNRHQHLVTLAKAYCLTQEERLVTEVVREWYHWQRENPYPIGINWASSLEVAFRSLSWLWVQYLLAGCPAVPNTFWPDLLRALSLSGRHINRYLSTYSSPNTHLLGEGVALFFIGTLCSQLSKAERWKRCGWQIVLQQAERQVQADGMHFEQSFYYHVYALDFFLHARTLAACNRIPIPVEFDQTLQKMLEILTTLSQAGPPPAFGDDDGGRVFNPRRNRAEHLKDPLTIGAAVFDRADFKANARELTEEMVWLLGSEGVAHFDRLPIASTHRVLSTRYEASGLCVMGDSEPVPQQLVIDAGHQGSGSAGHGHADALSLQLSVNGRRWLVDPGTFCYISSTNERDQFRGTAAHNTLRVDGKDQAEPGGPFSWRSVPDVRVDQWIVGETFDLFEGSHTGYQRLPEPVVHRRWVFGLKSGFWIIRDLAEGKGHHEIKLFWHLAPDSTWTTAGTNGGILGVADKEELVFLPLQCHGWTQESSSGSVSPAYGIKAPGQVLCYSARAALPVEFVVLLLPAWDGRRTWGTFTQIDERAASPSVRGYRYNSFDESHFLFFAGSNQRWELSWWASDAQFLYCGLDSRAGKCHWVLCEGSSIELNGQRVASFKHRVSRWEWISMGDTKTIFCSDQSSPSQVFEEGLRSLETYLKD